MVQDDQILELLPLQMHPDSNSRHMIRRTIEWAWGQGKSACRRKSVAKRNSRTEHFENPLDYMELWNTCWLQFNRSLSDLHLCSDVAKAFNTNRE